ncbi:RING-type E3 ubiquitin-protein ligase ppil2 [Thoreauomyces humboldtii]|nr:RING-type E3 ubiquitin-protein ligase ppil2 [Thoreauomyces humboldtii]
MGKGTDKLYVTHSEHAAGPGGAKVKTGAGEFKKLPFSCCSLSLAPFEHPVCTRDGMIFDLMNIIPWLKKHGKNPVTGEQLETKDLIKLNFHKNADDQYHCPITFKVFNDNTHIVAIKPSGNVYSHEAVDRLNIKTKNWVDLISDEPFKRKDIITIQDPHNIVARNISDFYYIKNDLPSENVERKKKEADPTYRINAKGSTEKVLALTAAAAAAAAAKAATVAATTKPVTITPSFVSRERKQYNAAHFSNGAGAASLTSTAVPVQTQNSAALWDEDEYMFDRVKEKGYAQIKTNLGTINLELYCDEAPHACYNMIQLAKKGYYDGSRFHRSIKNFMIQGGDPTGTGRGGESCWGKPFDDEFKPSLKHTGRGILSMANKGKNTNTSQFFITYRSCPHLDNKHTIFGKVVGGLDVLDLMEKVPTDDRERPETDITMLAVNVLVDPFESWRTKRETKAAALEERERTRNGQPGGVGKYMAGADGKVGGGGAKRKADDGLGIEWGAADPEVATRPPHAQKKGKGTGGFGSFDGW